MSDMKAIRKALAAQLIAETEQALALMAGSPWALACQQYIAMKRAVAQAEDPRPGGDQQ